MMMVLVMAPCFALVEILACYEAQTRSRGAPFTPLMGPLGLLKGIRPIHHNWLSVSFSTAGTSEMSLRLQRGETPKLKYTPVPCYKFVGLLSKNKPGQKRLGRFRSLLEQWGRLLGGRVNPHRQTPNLDRRTDDFDHPQAPNPQVLGTQKNKP